MVTLNCIVFIFKSCGASWGKQSKCKHFTSGSGALLRLSPSMLACPWHTLQPPLLQKQMMLGEQKSSPSLFCSIASEEEVRIATTVSLPSPLCRCFLKIGPAYAWMLLPVLPLIKSSPVWNAEMQREGEEDPFGAFVLYRSSLSSWNPKCNPFNLIWRPWSGGDGLVAKKWMQLLIKFGQSLKQRICDWCL